MNRTEIFKAIDQERAYQQQKWGDDLDNNATAEHWATYIARYLGKAIDGPPINLEQFASNMLKVATIAVGALEALGRTGELLHREDGVARPAKR